MRYKYTIFVESVIINEIRQKIRQILNPAACGIICVALWQGRGRGFEEPMLRMYEYTSSPLEKMLWLKQSILVEISFVITHYCFNHMLGWFEDCLFRISPVKGC